MRTFAFFPRYDPDSNPIAKAFAKPNALLATAAARIVELVRNATDNLAATFKPT